MPINSKMKGKAGELELAEFLRSHGVTAARRNGQQGIGGSVEAPDVSGLPGYHIECKRCETGSLYDWLDQSRRDAGSSSCTPIVFHRKNHKKWVAILDAEDFLKVICKC